MSEKLIDPMIEPIGLGLQTHKLLCWLCKKNHAVYSANPDWIFYPCWDCQRVFKSRMFNSDSWFTRLLLKLLNNRPL